MRRKKTDEKGVDNHGRKTAGANGYEPKEQGMAEKLPAYEEIEVPKRALALGSLDTLPRYEASEVGARNKVLDYVARLR